MVDGFLLEVCDAISGHPLYKIRSSRGVNERVKNLIFGSTGPKPEIILSDSISNDIQIVKNAEYCLIYDLPIPQTGLLWKDLVSWWKHFTREDLTDIGIERNLFERLKKSLNSPPERLFFYNYFRLFRSVLKDNLPALIPQVYLHYDPYTMKQLQSSKRIPRQRMDFLILFSNYERIIIEIDGRQHYSDGEISSPAKYAEMASEDRKLRLNGYEVYRFGGRRIKRIFCYGDCQRILCGALSKT